MKLYPIRSYEEKIDIGQDEFVPPYKVKLTPLNQDIQGFPWWLLRVTLITITKTGYNHIFSVKLKIAQSQNNRSTFLSHKMCYFKYQEFQ